MQFTWTSTKCRCSWRSSRKTTPWRKTDTAHLKQKTCESEVQAVFCATHSSLLKLPVVSQYLGRIVPIHLSLSCTNGTTMVRTYQQIRSRHRSSWWDRAGWRPAMCTPDTTKRRNTSATCRGCFCLGWPHTRGKLRGGTESISAFLKKRKQFVLELSKRNTSTSND